ncbi:MAG: hypothetical protein ACRD1Z_01605, partial [Vicinamibacteria bacterium]
MSELLAGGHTVIRRNGLSILLVCTAFLLLAGCAAGSAYRKGEQAEKRDDWDRSVVEYVRALGKSPGNTRYTVALARARLKSSAMHFERGKAYQKAGQLELAQAEYEQTIFLDPANQFASQELQRVQEAIRRKQMAPSEI